MAISIRIVGLDDLIAKLGQKRALPPLERFLDRAAFAVEANAKRLAPVDTGHLRRSITTNKGYLSRKIGPGAPYGFYVEKGTSAHWPPPAALEGWARRHGMGPGGGFLVARAISRRGTRPRPYMQPGAEATIPQIQAFLPTLVAEIEQAFI